MCDYLVHFIAGRIDILKWNDAQSSFQANEAFFDLAKSKKPQTIKKS